jgi:hypothetical protein
MFKVMVTSRCTNGLWPLATSGLGGGRVRVFVDSHQQDDLHQLRIGLARIFVCNLLFDLIVLLYDGR